MVQAIGKSSGQKYSFSNCLIKFDIMFSCHHWVCIGPFKANFTKNSIFDPPTANMVKLLQEGNG